ncbi:MAG: FkbM family methyltransferase [Candidatus Binataceae bacterium]
MNEVVFSTIDFKTDSQFPVCLRLARWFGHQHWIPHGRDRVLRLFYPPDRVEPFSFEVPFFGMRYRGNLSNFLDWSVFFYGSYATDELRLMAVAAACLRKSALKVVCVDVGVNVGHHLLFMDTIADELHGFEPYEPALRLAREKLAINGIDRAHLYPIALGDVDEKRTFFAPTTENPSGTLVAGYSENTADIGIRVDVRHGSRFFEKEGIKDVGILKIDVDGFEAEVCRGLTQILQRDRPFMLLELSSQTIDAFAGEAKFRDVLYEGARIYRCVGRQIRRFDFDLPSGFVELIIVPAEHDTEFTRLWAERDEKQKRTLDRVLTSKTS